MTAQLNLMVDFYINEKTPSQKWITLTQPQKQHLTGKLCSMFDSIDSMEDFDRDDLLKFINSVMCQGKGFTFNHLETMIAMSGKCVKRNPILLELGYLTDNRSGNNHCRKTDYRKYIHLSIRRNKYDWSYEDMMTAARLHSKGVPVNNHTIPYETILTTDHYADIQSMYDILWTKFNKTMEDQEERYQETLDNITKALGGEIDKLVKMVDELKQEVGRTGVTADDIRVKLKQDNIVSICEDQD